MVLRYLIPHFETTFSKIFFLNELLSFTIHMSQPWSLLYKWNSTTLMNGQTSHLNSQPEANGLFFLSKCFDHACVTLPLLCHGKHSLKSKSGSRKADKLSLFPLRQIKTLGYHWKRAARSLCFGMVFWCKLSVLEIHVQIDLYGDYEHKQKSVFSNNVMVTFRSQCVYCSL